jgi:hypothetical protein
MMFVGIENKDESIEILVFPRTYEETKDMWVDGKIVVVSGKISDKDDQIKLLVDSAKEINEEEYTTFQRMNATRKKYEKQRLERELDERRTHEVIAQGSMEPSATELNNVPSHVTSVEHNTKNEPEHIPKIDQEAEKEFPSSEWIIPLPKAATKDTIARLAAQFKSCRHGQTKIVLEHNGTKLQTPYRLDVDTQLQQKVTSILSNTHTT